MTEFKLTLAENGFVLENNKDNLLLVYEGTKLSFDLLRELMCDLEMALDSEDYKFKITVNVEPIKDDTEG